MPCRCFKNQLELTTCYSCQFIYSMSLPCQLPSQHISMYHSLLLPHVQIPTTCIIGHPKMSKMVSMCHFLCFPCQQRLPPCVTSHTTCTSMLDGVHLLATVRKYGFDYFFMVLHWCTPRYLNSQMCGSTRYIDGAK